MLQASPEKSITVSGKKISVSKGMFSFHNTYYLYLKDKDQTLKLEVVRPYNFDSLMKMIASADRTSIHANLNSDLRHSTCSVTFTPEQLFNFDNYYSFKGDEILFDSIIYDKADRMIYISGTKYSTDQMSFKRPISIPSYLYPAILNRKKNVFNFNAKECIDFIFSHRISLNLEEL